VFIPRPADERLPLRLPTALTVAAPAPRPAPPTVGSPELTLPTPPVVSPNGGEPVHLAVERRLKTVPSRLTTGQLRQLLTDGGRPCRPITSSRWRLGGRYRGRGGPAAQVVAKQRIHVGIVHAGRTLTVETGDATWRIYDEDHLVAEVARTTTKSVARFKVHKPEPPRRPQTAGPAPTTTTSATVNT
jgi:hypothetical protein